MSESTIRRVGVVIKPQHTQALKILCELVKWFNERDISLSTEPLAERGYIEKETHCSIQSIEREELAKHVDLLVVLGGDGTMLSAARMIDEHDIPVMGVNLGRLGYLAEFNVEELFPALESILAGDYRVDKRVMLNVELMRGEEKIASGRVLNDVVINKAALARIIEIEAHFDNLYVNSFRADGLIVSTPTGSTAYNLSAGGPIVYPSMNAVVVTPICPFTMSNRPIVIPDRATIELCLKTNNEEVIMTLDGQTGFPLRFEDKVLICKNEATFNIVQPKSKNYFDVLRDKLKWGR